MEALIRPAVKNDAPRIAYIMYLAGRGQVERSVYDLIIPGAFGPTPDRLFVMERLLTTKVVSMYHHTHFTVAEVGGEVVSALSCFPFEDGRVRHIRAAFREIGWSDGDMLAMVDRIEPFTEVEPKYPHDHWIIENAATYEGYRGRGLMRMLFEGAIEKGRARGYTTMHLSCFTGNPAVDLYEKLGFRVTRTSTGERFEEIFGCPGMHEMTLVLDD
jgi:ribosomal protein S18 acetylase RimI-like enzyme